MCAFLQLATHGMVRNTIKDTRTTMRNLLPELCREGLHMIVLVFLVVFLRGFPCFHDFSHGASLHPYSMIFALVPNIFHGSHLNAATRMRTCVTLHLDHVLV